MKKDVYAALTAAGIETRNNYSDLYARDSEACRRIIYDCGYAVVTSQADAEWLILPFAYTPFWAASELYAGWKLERYGR